MKTASFVHLIRRPLTVPDYSRQGLAVIGLAAWLASSAPASAQGPLRVSVDAAHVSLYTGDRPLVQYRYAQVPFKPYVDQLASPHGVNILRDAPHDHLHHHGLMFAVSVDGVNFWEERDAPGRETHLGITDVRVDDLKAVRRAGFTENLVWTTSTDNRTLLHETRRIEVVVAGNLDATLLTWESRLTAPPGKASVVVAGANYYGLGMRFLPSMDTGGQFLNAEGKTGVAATNAVRSSWCAFSASADGKPVTVAQFNHPGNIRHPATWFTLEKPFCYLSATLNLSKEPLTLTAAKPLVLRYGVALWDGNPDPDRIQRVYKQWVSLVDALNTTTRPE